MKQNNSKAGIGKIVLLVCLFSVISLYATGCGIPAPTLISLKAIRNEECNYREVFSEDYYCNIDYNDTTFRVNDGYATCEGMVDEKFNDYLRIKGKAESVWSYNKDLGEWRFFRDSLSVCGTVNIEVEGSWEIYESNSCIYVKNQTESGMDVFVENYNAFGNEWVHVENRDLYADELNELVNYGRLCAVYQGKNTDGEIVKVTFFMSRYNELGIEVDAGGSGRHGFYYEYVPNC